MKKEEKWQLVEDGYAGTFITDTINHLRLANLVESGFGLKSSTKDLGQKVCDYLNEIGAILPF